jgi:hypothetical protein
MDNNLPLQIRLFNDKVRAMNQANGKILTLNSQEARGLHAEIYDLMATIASLNQASSTTVSEVNISMDGGGFK